MHYSPIFLIVLFTLQKSWSAETTCEQSQKLFADLCFSPSPALDLDIAWLKDNQPTEGWYAGLGNDVNQLHISELLKGELLNATNEDFTDMCLRVKIEHGDGKNSGDGEFFGYKDLNSTFVCKLSNDFPGAQRCVFSSVLTKYGEDDLSYIIYSHENFLMSINCYPNGQVGWVTISKLPKISEEDKKTALDKAASLGFPVETNANLFGENCSA